MDNKEFIERHTKILTFLKTFDGDVKKISDRLLERYKSNPSDTGDIVMSVTITICARLMLKTIPRKFLEQALVHLAHGVLKE